MCRFVAHVDDASALMSMRILQELGAEVTTLRGPDPCVNKNETLLITARTFDGRALDFPSAHLRQLVLPKDEASRGLLIPSFARTAQRIVALRPITQVTPGLEEALRQLRFLDEKGKWTGPKRKRPPWRSGRKARLHEERACVAL